LIVEPRSTILRRIDRRLSFFSGPAVVRADGALIRDCMLGLKRYAEDLGVTSLVSSGRDYPYAYDWGRSKVHLQTIGEYFVDLGDPWEHVMARMRKSIPEQARKAQRSGLTFHEHRGASMLSDLFRLLECTKLRRKEKSGIYFSSYYLPHLAEGPLRPFGESDIARFFVARKGADVLCTLLVSAFRTRAYALLIGCSEDGYRLRAPAFVWFNAMRRLKAAGIESLNLAGAGPQSKLAFAKLSLGADRRACTGSISPYLQGPARNLLYQAYRWRDNLSALAARVRHDNSGAA
jgi:hypothetical protein